MTSLPGESKLPVETDRVANTCRGRFMVVNL